LLPRYCTFGAQELQTGEASKTVRTEPTQPDVQGDLRQYPLPRLLFYLYRQGYEGRLEIDRREGGTARIFFRAGVPAYVTAPSLEDVLGRVLLEQGWISTDQYEQSLGQLAQRKRLHGQILLEMGAIDQRRLIEGLRLQLRRKLNRLFFYHESPFRLFSESHACGQDDEAQYVRADPLWVIYHGVRNALDPARLAIELSKLENARVRMNPSYEALVPRYGMGNADRGLVTLLLRGDIETKQIRQISNLSPVETQMVLYALWVTEGLIVTEARQAMAPLATTAPPLAKMPDAGGRDQPPGAASGPGTRVPPVPPKVQLVSAPQQTRPPAQPASRATFAKESSPDVASIVEQFESIPTTELLHKADGPSIICPPPAAPNTGAAPIAAPVQDVPPPLSSPSLVVPPPAAMAGQAIISPPPPLTDNGLTTPPPSQTTRTTAPIAVPLAPARATTTGEDADAGAQPEPALSTDSQQVAAKDSAAARQLRAAIKQKHKELDQQNFFELLGLDRKATLPAIRDAYFKMAKQFHPDRASALGLDDLEEAAAEIFRLLNEANSILSDTDKRKDYLYSLDHSQQDVEEAQNALKAEVAFQKGLVFFRKKDFSAALDEFGEAWRLNDKEGEHLAWLVWTQYCDPKRSKKELLATLKGQIDQAVKLSPKSADTWYYHGEIHLALEDNKKATASFEKAVDLKAGHVEALRRLRLMRMRQEKSSGKTGLFGRLRKK